MIIFSSNGPGTERPTPAKVRALLECEEIQTYSECGWFCATGFKKNAHGEGVRKVVALHFNTEKEYLSMTGQGRRPNGKNVLKTGEIVDDYDGSPFRP